MSATAWGIKPILFSIENIQISSYSFFVGLGLLVGILFYYYEAKKQNNLSKHNPYIILGSLVGGVIGAKFLELIVNYRYIFSGLINVNNIFFGKTIIGGLIGGFIGVRVVKNILKIKDKRGNLFAPAIALGVSIGRLGCFMRGCCYGKASNLPWSVNFGDGILRHPTQIYESIFMLGMFVYLELIKNKTKEPGKLFKILMINYFIFRFFIEFIRIEETIFIGLTLFQIISIVAIIYLIKDNLIKLILNYQFSFNKK